MCSLQHMSRANVNRVANLQEAAGDLLGLQRISRQQRSIHLEKIISLEDGSVALYPTEVPPTSKSHPQVSSPKHPAIFQCRPWNNSVYSEEGILCIIHREEECIEFYHFYYHVDRQTIQFKGQK